MNRGLKYAAVLALAASLWAVLSDQPAVAEDDPPAPGTMRRYAGEPVAHAPRGEASGPAVDLFPAQDWRAERVETEASAPAVRQENVLAPLPFSVAGAWADGDERVIFIQDGERVLPVCASCATSGAQHPGALIGAYRLEAVAADFIEFTRLPGKQRQRLRIEP